MIGSITVMQSAFSFKYRGLRKAIIDLRTSIHPCVQSKSYINLGNKLEVKPHIILKPREGKNNFCIITSITDKTRVSILMDNKVFPSKSLSTVISCDYSGSKVEGTFNVSIGDDAVLKYNFYSGIIYETIYMKIKDFVIPSDVMLKISDLISSKKNISNYFEDHNGSEYVECEFKSLIDWISNNVEPHNSFYYITGIENDDESIYMLLEANNIRFIESAYPMAIMAYKDYIAFAGIYGFILLNTKNMKAIVGKTDYKCRPKYVKIEKGIDCLYIGNKKIEISDKVKICESDDELITNIFENGWEFALKIKKNKYIGGYIVFDIPVYLFDRYKHILGSFYVRSIPLSMITATNKIYSAYECELSIPGAYINEKTLYVYSIPIVTQALNHS